MNKVSLFFKQSFSLWLSVATYAITAGIFIPRIVDIVLAGRLPFTIMFGQISIIREIFMLISSLIGIWIGVFLSTKYLFKEQHSSWRQGFCKNCYRFIVNYFIGDTNFVFLWKYL